MPTHYCHNCRHYSELPDGVHCEYCLTFFYANSRMPRVSDYKPPETALESLYATMGWETVG